MACQGWGLRRRGGRDTNQEWISNEPADIFQDWDRNDTIKFSIILFFIISIFFISSAFISTIIQDKLHLLDDLILYFVIPLTAFAGILEVFLYAFFIYDQKNLISEVLFKDDRVIIKCNSGEKRELLYNKLEKIKPYYWKMFGIEMRDPTGKTYSVRYIQSSWRGVRFQINKEIAILLEEKIKLSGSTPSPAPSRG